LGRAALVRRFKTLLNRRTRLEGLSGHTDVLEEQAPPPAPTKGRPGVIS
jgi:hypothetical protein